MTAEINYTRLDDMSEAHLSGREALRIAEGALIEQREVVAALRRSLPPGPELQNYTLIEARSGADGRRAGSQVELRDLVPTDGRPLVVFHMMFGKAQHHPCPMCSMWLDGLDGVAMHLAENVEFVVVAAAQPEELADHPRTQWPNLRLLSAGDSTFAFDLGTEDEAGNQTSTVSVFDRSEDGSPRFRYSMHPYWSPTDHQRGIDLLSPVWHVLDLTPNGRGDWYPST